MLTVPRGAALYVGALVGPGLLLVPALATSAAGPASIVAWAALLVLSAPLAVTFAVACAMYAVVFGANALGLRMSSGFQLVLSAVLVGVVAVAVGVALPRHATENWTPFAPHGWWAVGTAANILMWLFIGWEAMAQLAGDFRDPARELPRAMALAFAIIT